MPEDGIVALDNGMYKIWFARNYRTWMPNTLLLDNALATMGAGLPSAMMAAMLHPDRRVLAVCGDGGFMMNSQELETAVRLKLNLVVLILEDNAYGMIRWKQAVDHFADWGLTFGNPDFVKYAEAYGAKGSRVEATEDLVPTLEAAFAGGGVHLVTVPIDYSENMRVLVDELKNRVPARGWRQGAWLARMTEIEVRAPYDGQLIDTVETSGADAVEAALATAYRLFRDRDAWLSPAARVEVLRETARLHGRSRPRIWRVEAAQEGGKPLVDSRVEVARAIDGVLQQRRAAALGGRPRRADGRSTAPRRAGSPSPGTSRSAWWSRSAPSTTRST